jgi:hypothetical protein
MGALGGVGGDSVRHEKRSVSRGHPMKLISTGQGKGMKSDTYKFIDEQSQQVLLLFRFVSQQGKQEADCLSPNIWKRVVE